MSSDITYELPPYQKDFITSKKEFVSIVGAKGSSKAQPLTEPVLTPDGFVPMGEIKKGDAVIGSDGRPTLVTGVYPQGRKPVYRVDFSDGTFTRATFEHLWSVQTGSQKSRTGKFLIKTTAELAIDLKTKQGYNKWYLPIVEPIQYKEKHLPIKPYALGALLGDGGMSKKNLISFSSADKEIVKRLELELGATLKHRSNYDYDVCTYERCAKGHCKNNVIKKMREIGLQGKKSDKKFIPQEYLMGSVQQRKELLRGLMDTDGYVNSGKTANYCTTSIRLAESVQELARSLGLTTSYKRYKQKNDKYLDYFIVRINSPFNPFWIKRKAEKFNVNATQGRTKSITDIVFDDWEECQCISVDAKDSLYVTRDYILTHNTWSGVRFVAMQLSMQPNTQGLVMFNTRQQAEDIFRQEMEPLLQDLNWPYEFNGKSLNMKSMGSVVHWRSSEAGSVRNIESVVYHWGWADEASYYDPAALQTFASRIRKGLALKRVTSMPDEPDAYIYEFLEKQPGPLYEISLDDNPDKEFRERYKRFLKSIYSGPELERYLSGRRVSLEGMGLFAVEGHQRGQYGYDPDKPLMLSWDFNVEYRAVSAWQEIGKDENARPIIACVKSWQMKGATVQEDAVELSQKFKKHRNVIYLHGDASGQARSAQTTDSMWKMVRKEFQAECENIRYIVPSKNPPVKDTIQCLNWGLREGLVKFDKEEKNVYMSLSATKADKYGEPDKSMDYKQNSKARSHEADTARYAVWHYLHQIYPGNRGGFFII